MSDLGTTIRNIRLRNGLTGTAFGALVGVTQGRISEFETGVRYPTVATLSRIARLAAADETKVLQAEIIRQGIDADGISRIFNAIEVPSHTTNLTQEIKECHV